MKVGDKLLCRHDALWREERFLIKDNYYFEFGSPPYNSPYIWDYFYTVKEERKLKLSRLNESW